MKNQKYDRNSPRKRGEINLEELIYFLIWKPIKNSFRYRNWRYIAWQEGYLQWPG